VVLDSITLSLDRRMAVAVAMAAVSAQTARRGRVGGGGGRGTEGRCEWRPCHTA